MKSRRLFCPGFQYKQVCWTKIKICLTTKEVGLSERRLFPLHEGKLWEPPLLELLQHYRVRHTAPSELGRRWASWVIEIFISYFYHSFLCFLVETIPSNISPEEKYHQDKPALWRVMANLIRCSFVFLTRATGSQGLYGNIRIAEQWASLRSDASSIVSKANSSRKHAVPCIRALFKDLITLSILQEIQKQINMWLSVLALLLLCLTAMTTLYVCPI